jgi:hypothetical protein
VQSREEQQKQKAPFGTHALGWHVENHLECGFVKDVIPFSLASLVHFWYKAARI